MVQAYVNNFFHGRQLVLPLHIELIKHYNKIKYKDNYNDK